MEVNEAINRLKSMAENSFNKAIGFKEKKCFTEAVLNLDNAIDLFKAALSLVGNINDENGQLINARITNCTEEKALTKQRLINIANKSGCYDEIISLPEGTRHVGFQYIFNRFLNEDVDHIEIFDENIMSANQVENLVRFCEVVVKGTTKRPLTIRLHTFPDKQSPAAQHDRFRTLKKSLEMYDVLFHFTVNDVFSDGYIQIREWTVFINNGLNYLQVPKNCTIGMCDFSLRKSIATDIVMKFRPIR